MRRPIVHSPDGNSIEDGAAPGCLTRRRFVGRGAALLGLAAAGSLELLTSACSDSPTGLAGRLGTTNPLNSARNTMSRDMNVVLVHGAWADGSSWSRVIPSLERAGFNVTAVPIPLSSLPNDVAKTSAVLHRVLKAQPLPTLLVAHSWGGAVITGAGNDPNVVGLVYVAGFAPDSGESVNTLLQQFPPEPGPNHLIGPDEEGFLWFEPTAYLQYFCPDIEPNEAQIMAATQRPLAAAAFVDTVPQAAWRSKPSWYLVAENDQIINPDLERFMARRMGAELHSVRSSHVAMLTHPRVVIDLIQEAAAATSMAASR